MSTHFKWYPAEAEVIVPWNARYSFPSVLKSLILASQQGDQDDAAYPAKEQQ